MARADRPRGGRRGRGLGALRRPSGEGLFNGVVETRRRRRRQPALRLRAGALRGRLGVRHAARRGRARRQPRVGRARLRLGARQGPDGDEARGPRLVGEGHGRLRRARQPAPRLRHHAGARRARHELRPRVPRRPRRIGDRGLARDDPGRPRRRSAPTPSRRAATCCSPTAPTRTRSPASRSRPTTCAAPTPPPSPRWTPSSSTTCARAGLAEADAKKLVIDGFLQELVERTIEGPIRDALASSLERRLAELLAVPA